VKSWYSRCPVRRLTRHWPLDSDCVYWI